MSDPNEPRPPDWWAPPPDDAPPEWGASPPSSEPPPGYGPGFAPPGDATAAPPPQPPPPYGPPGQPPPPPQYGYPQAPVGYPGGYVPYGPAVGTSSTNGMAVASMICGIVSIVLGFLCFIGIIAAIPGLILGIVGMRQVGQSNGTQQGRGMAIAGIVTSAISLVLVVVGFVIYGAFLIGSS